MRMQKFLAGSLLACAIASSSLVLDASPARAEAERTRQLAEAAGRYIPPVPAKKTDISLVIRTRWQEIYQDPAAPVIGNPQGEVTLVMFFDYRCPYCKKVAPVVEQLARTDPSVRVVYKELPILGRASLLAARVALAAERQGKYIEFHRAMMETRGRVTDDTIMTVARKVGLDMARLKQDLADPEIDKVIQRNKDLAAALHIYGTPSYVINSKVARGTGDLDDFRELVADDIASE
jgi:protein-disulfide isomerase